MGCKCQLGIQLVFQFLLGNNFQQGKELLQWLYLKSNKNQLDNLDKMIATNQVNNIQKRI